MHEKMTFPVKMDESSPLYKALVVSKCRLDLACFPTESVDEFFEENFAYDYEALKAKEKNESNVLIWFIPPYLCIEMGGTYDYFNDRDRWQFWSKQLQQNQELIHRAMKQIQD